MCASCSDGLEPRPAQPKLRCSAGGARHCSHFVRTRYSTFPFLSPSLPPSLQTKAFRLIQRKPRKRTRRPGLCSRDSSEVISLQQMGSAFISGGYRPRKQSPCGEQRTKWSERSTPRPQLYVLQGSGNVSPTSCRTAPGSGSTETKHSASSRKRQDHRCTKPGPSLTSNTLKRNRFSTSRSASYARQGSLGASRIPSPPKQRGLWKGERLPIILLFQNAMRSLFTRAE